MFVVRIKVAGGINSAKQGIILVGYSKTFLVSTLYSINKEDIVKRILHLQEIVTKLSL
jgi:hypothetical protein